MSDELTYLSTKTRDLIPETMMCFHKKWTMGYLLQPYGFIPTRRVVVIFGVGCLRTRSRHVQFSVVITPLLTSLLKAIVNFRRYELKAQLRLKKCFLVGCRGFLLNRQVLQTLKFWGPPTQLIKPHYRFPENRAENHRPLVLPGLESLSPNSERLRSSAL